jgi:Condensation domain
MSEDRRTLLKQWLDNGELRLHPLTFPQRELWETSPVPVADVANHICCLISLRGLITYQECQAALQRVVERQEVLRLSFLSGKDRPLQMVRKSREANIRFRELSSAEAQPEALEELAQEIFSEPFDLVQGPLYRAQVLRRAPDDHVLVVAIHHAIADGWTLGIFVQDLVAAHAGALMGRRGALPPVPLPYTDWGAVERGFWQPAELERRAAFWKSRLAGARRLWNAAKPSGTEWSKPERWVSRFQADLEGAVRELARRNSTTLFTVLLAGFQIALSRWAGAEDVLVGTPVANRGRLAVRETMGYCAGIVPLRGQIDRARPFSAGLQAVHQASVDCFANAMPFAELVRALGEPPAPGRNPVFEVRFALQNHPIPDVVLPTLSARLRMRSTGTSRFDLGCELTEQGEGLEVVWLFQPSLFSRKDIQRLDGMFRAVLAGAYRSPEARTAALIT